MKGIVHVRCAAAFKGYTDGTVKDSVDGFMSTGDVGHFDDEGLLFIDGRADDMIVSGGENVYPQEIENLLAGHREVVDVAVVGVPDHDFGHRLRAVIVAGAGSNLDSETVRRYVKDNLARHKVPRDVLFVQEIPRNATGKVIRKELLDIP
ncbi:AMP-binding enzyme [Gordonia liuliyuniae]|uniref:AMP-binding enzyme n=1 Tax=Gordonia liuliyuniae TaxID=2911517 RepID=UPI0027DF4D8F|nr:AMP-binding protein [Gordonia liuliyuniae]